MPDPSITNIVDLRVWGKSRHLTVPYPLVWHLVDTAAVAGELWDYYLTPAQQDLITLGLGGSHENARQLVAFWAALHDVGKVTPGFQRADIKAFDPLEDDPAYSGTHGSQDLHHAYAGQLALPALLKELGYPNGPAGRSLHPWYRVAQIVGGHHGTFRQSRDGDPLSRHLGHDGWTVQRHALVTTLHQALGAPLAPERVDGVAAVLITGIVILADWLASQDDFLRQQQSRLPGSATSETIEARLTQLAPVVRMLRVEAGLGLPQLREGTFEECFSFPPNALQRSVLKELLPNLSGPGLLLVTAATGDGKTEAALAAARALAQASNAGGFYFALPTMATADEMYRRVRRFVTGLAAGDSAVTLLHSMSWLNEDYQARQEVNLAGSTEVACDDRDSLVEAPQWLRGRKRGLLAPLSVGTIDQALIGALTTKHNALRLLGLSSKVFIVDEAHAYDEYMQNLLVMLLQWLGALGCSVVVLSATLPSSMSTRLLQAYAKGSGRSDLDVSGIRYPGWIFLPEDASRPLVTISEIARKAVIEGRRIDLSVEIRPVHHGGEMDADDRLLNIRAAVEPTVDQGGCAAVICNTVDDAQRTYRSVQEWVGGRAEVLLLHSRFPARRREELTVRVTARLGKNVELRKPTVVVATQVIEQSLDLDFDLVVSDLAPAAQLLQRAGRCHRHILPDRPTAASRPRLVVLDPRDEQGHYHQPKHWGRVYASYLLRATHLMLAALPASLIQVPDDVQPLMESVYGPPAFDDAQLEQEHVEYQAEAMAQGQYAGFVRVPAPGLLMDLSGMSDKNVEEAMAVTRLGADSLRIVCCYLGQSGGRYLDTERRRPLPDGGPQGRLSVEDVRQVLAETIPVRASVLSGYSPTEPAPATWTTNAWLKDVVPVWFPTGENEPSPVLFGQREVSLDADLGLLIGQH